MSLYLWVKAAHIIFVIAWMAGLLMAPRLRVYQLSQSPGEPVFELMSSASQRLRRIILTPAFIVTWLLGLSLIWLNPAVLQAGWFHLKFLLVLAMSGIHGWFVIIGRTIDAGQTPLSEKRLRLLNEVPFIVMMGIVILAVVKPF